MKKIALIIVSTIILISGLMIIRQIRKPANLKAYTIGILQTASHPALDAVRDGFIDEIHQTFGDTVNVIVQNAQGSIADAHALAQQFHANSAYSGFFAIATPAAQAMATVEKTKPIIIAAVTDPNALGLINPTTNVCGTKDMIDVPGQVTMLKQLVPDAKVIGLLYNSGEINSTTLAQQMRQELKKHGLTSIDFAVSSEADIPAMIELASRKADVILAPTDNTVASTISLIASMANKYKKPLIVSDNMLVKFGALAARGVDYKESGKQAARIAYEVIVEGKKPYELPIEPAKTDRIFINKKTLSLLGLSIPKNMQKNVTLVEDSQ